MNPEVPQKPEQKVEFLENSILLDIAREKYLSFEKGEISIENLNDWVKSDEGFGVHDRESFNCHSFVLSVMKNDLNMDKVSTFEDVYMDIDKWKDEGGEIDSELWAMYQEHVTEEFPPDTDERMKRLRVFQENILDNSNKYSLKQFYDELKKDKADIMKRSIEVGDQGLMSDEKYDALCDESSEKLNELMKEFKVIKKKKMNEFVKVITGDMVKNNSSRFAFIFDEKDGAESDHADDHSFIILGQDSSKEDLVILEKKGPGDEIRLNKISKVVEKYLDQGLTINIPSKNVSDLYLG